MHVLADSLKSAALVFHVHVSNVCVLFNQVQHTVLLQLHQDNNYTKVPKLDKLAAQLDIHGQLLRELPELTLL